MAAMLEKTQSSTPSWCYNKSATTWNSNRSRSNTTQVEYGPVIVCILYAFCVGQTYGQSGLPGSWEIVVPNAGVATMHAGLTRFGNVVLLDRTNIGATTLPLPGGACRDDPNELVLKHDCSAHSALFDPSTNTVRALTIETDTWCSSGQFTFDGTLVQTGGDFDGNTKVRTFSPCPSNGTCDWVESPFESLQTGRWYATNQLLPDGRQIIVGGRSTITYEFLPANGIPQVQLPFLQATQDAQTDNLYPYVHLLPDGTLYIFANRDSIIYNYITNTVLKTFPTIPGEPRNYPSAGSSVMLPLMASENYGVVEVLICGGAQFGAFQTPGANLTCSQTCGRMSLWDPNATWAMETMPYPRCMGDMIILPSRKVLIINGAQEAPYLNDWGYGVPITARQGSQGWGNANNPALNPVAYDPDAAFGLRFAPWAPTTIPRMYHSTANLLDDGRVLLAGSNTHQFYTFTGPFPTELRIEAFSPPYLDATYDTTNRPTIISSPPYVTYNTQFTIVITLPLAPVAQLELNLLSAPFVTHSYAQGQRLLSLLVAPLVQVGPGTYNLTATAPTVASLAPSAYYMIFVVNQGIPGKSAWIQVVS